jgi:hypothetical protein
MTRLKPFRFWFADGHEAVFYAPTYSQARELMLTWRRARGLASPLLDTSAVRSPDEAENDIVGDESDRVAWNLPKAKHTDAQALSLDSAA